MKREIKVFDPRYGWGVVVGLNKDNTYSILVKFKEDSDTDVYTDCGRYLLGLKQSLSFTDYTGSEPAEWVTLEKLEAMNKPELVEGKLYKVWKDNMIEGCYIVAKCTNAQKQKFATESSSFHYDNYSELKED